MVTLPTVDGLRYRASKVSAGAKNHLGPRPSILPRRFHAYGVGTAKSGTTSLAAIFQPHYRSRHEPLSRPLLLQAAKRPDGLGEPTGFPVLRRDVQLRLEMDSSQLNFVILGDLVRAFPDARFVVTIRDCFSWVESFINHQLSRPPKPRSGPLWSQFRDDRFRASQLRHPPEEIELQRRGLYTLEGYFSYWALHNRAALDLIPADRRLILRTTDIGNSLDQLATFLSIPVETLSGGQAHENRAKGRYGVLDEVPQDHVIAVARQQCGELMEELFPTECRW